MLNITNVKLGADPELFVKDKLTGAFVPSLDLIGGDKWCPRDVGGGFSVQEDNILVEFNIPPSPTRESFIANIEQGIELTRNSFLREGFDVDIRPSFRFSKEMLSDPRAMVFGCEPDFNAWLKGEVNIKPNTVGETLRSAGGHIHVGFDLQDSTKRESISMELIKWMDLFLGVPSIIMDKDTERKKLYGKAGAFRHKHYGAEYRTLSSFWLASKELIGWAYDQTMRAVEKTNEGASINIQESNAIQSAINFQNKDLCENLLFKYDLKVA